MGKPKQFRDLRLKEVMPFNPPFDRAGVMQMGIDDMNRELKKDRDQNRKV